MEDKIDVSIIIVNYNTSELTRKCLTSLAAAKKKTDRWEVIVVDNGSLPAMSNVKFPMSNVFLITNKENLGFAGGNNVGIKKARGRFILLLNSDTEVEKNTIAEMVRFMDEHPQAGAATCKIILPNGEMDPACHRGFPTPWVALSYFLGLEKLFPKTKLFGEYHQGYKDLDKIHEIDAPSGAFFMIRREVIEKVGLLDEDFFMYGEDIDWAYRIKLAGYKVMFNPKVTILHRKKQSGRESENPELRRQTQIYFYQTMKLFYRKHYFGRYPLLMTWLIVLVLDVVIFLTKKGWI